MMKTFAALVLALFVYSVDTVDRSKFKSCSQSAFCERARKYAPAETPFQVDLDTLQISPTSVEAVLVNSENNVRFRFEVFGLKDRTFRVKVKEAFPIRPRFEVPEVLDGEPEQSPVQVQKTDEGFTVALDDSNMAVVKAKPFKIDFFANGVLVLSTNSRGLMIYEHYREKNTEGAGEGEEGQPMDDQPGMWEESFGGHHDSKPRGPSTVAMDFAFMNMQSVFGIPEHADRFSLQDTSGGDPYRLYNLDVFEYELWNPMSLYAAVPFMLGHNAANTVGLFWLNAAETWIDVKKSGTGVLDSISNLVTSSQSAKNTDTYWISESGVMEFFVLLGPGPKDVSRQYAELTGTTPLPPEWSLGYHQCRWNYNDQDDVRTVEEKFDEYDIPMDVMWLDIEHTDGKKYFTWDGRKFSNSIEMTNNLTAHARKLVTIVDPHIKKENGYWVHEDCKAQGLYVKTKEGNDYEGWCWPGASYYPDFLNPAARQYFSEQYALDKYVGSTLDTYTWNDMNEPSVFNGPEVTMPKDVMHGDWEHRDVHNLYGHLYVMATHAGQLMRSDNKLRPFILTRSAFAGSQRIAAKWTGDNTADWGHVEASVPMCLSFSVTGISFCGADVGGFFGHPDGEMFVRWYQAAAFQPFFRSHAHIDSRRREPWLYSEGEMKLIRDAVRLRYSYLPLWYTLFHEGEQTGTPPMRPLWYEFPSDEGSFDVDKSHMVGDALLVTPVSQPSINQVIVYFPGGSSQLWYDIYTNEVLEDAAGPVNVPVTFDRIPVYQRGGTIVPKKERIRRSAPLMHDDPYTLVVALDREGKASGSLYIDDGKSFEYRDAGAFVDIQLTFSDNRLSGHVVSKPGYKPKSWLERVVILGLVSSPGKARVSSPTTAERALTTHFDDEKKVLVIRKPGVNIAEEWNIVLG